MPDSYVRFRLIDEHTRQDHYFLEPDDQVMYLFEYTIRAGFNHSATNDLIQNLKKPMDRKGRPEWPHKARAVRNAIRNVELAGPFTLPTTVVPMPPSKSSSDPLFDPRISQIAAGVSYFQDVRPLIVQDESTTATHEGGARHNPQEWAGLRRIDESVANPVPERIAVLDDIITTGAQFKGAKLMLQARYPGVPVFGLFLARSIRDPSAAF